MNLYNQENRNAMIREKKRFLVLWIVFLSLIVLGFVSLLLSASFETRVLIQAVGCVLLAFLFFFFLLFFLRFLALRKLALQWDYIISQPGKDFLAEVVECSPNPMTLSDGTKAREVRVKDENGILVLYVMECFDLLFEKGRRYRFVTVSDYIREAHDEN